MLPIIFVSDSQAKQEKFIEQLIEKESFLPYYIYKITPLKTEISIDQIRAIKKEIVTSTPSKRLFVIYSFETASLEAQNALLKTLEEQNEDNQFVLLVADIGRVISTVLSRSKIISEKNNDILEAVEENKRLLDDIEKNSNYGFMNTTAGMNREKALDLFDDIIILLRERLAKGSGQNATLLKKALHQKTLLLNNNLNPQLAVDSFLLFYKKKQIT